MRIVPYIVLGIAAAIAIAVAHYSWRRRSLRGAAALAGIAVSVAEWALTYALELASPGLSSKIVWAKLEYLGIVSVPLAWLVFTLHYTRAEKRLPRPVLALLAVIPCLTFALVLTNELHHLVWR